jgi:DNA primase large subunit
MQYQQYSTDLFILFGVDLNPQEMKEAIHCIGIEEEITLTDEQAIALRRVEKLSRLVEEDFEIQDKDKDDVIGHLILRMVAASDNRGTVETWFLNNEGSALRNKLNSIRRSDEDAFIEVLTRLLFVDKVLYLDDLYNYKMSDSRKKASLRKRTEINISNEYVCLNWQGIPKAVRDGQAILYEGIAIIKANDSTLISQAVNNYQYMLRSKIYGLASKITVERMNKYQELGDKLTKSIQATSVSFIGIEHLDEETRFFPPCMRGIDWMISNGMELERIEYLQMGFFLREVGMSLNDYLRYWYLRHPSNEGKSWQEFKSSHWGRYELPHHYGARGGGKKYNCYGCKTIQLEGFCPFKDWEDEHLENFVRSNIEGIYNTPQGEKRVERKIKHILNMQKKKYYGAGCSTEFELRFQIDDHNYVNHPIKQYYDPAKRIEKERIKKREKEEEKKSKDEKEE